MFDEKSSPSDKLWKTKGRTRALDTIKLELGCSNYKKTAICMHARSNANESQKYRTNNTITKHTNGNGHNQVIVTNVTTACMSLHVNVGPEPWSPYWDVHSATNYRNRPTPHPSTDVLALRCVGIVLNTYSPL